MSHLLFPVTNPAVNTINELNEDNTCKYEDVRMQFLLTGSDYKFNERDISKTIMLFLKSDLCSDPVSDYDGTEFIMVNNNTETPFQKLKRVYKTGQNEFVAKVLKPMQQNMRDVCDANPNDNELRTGLISEIGKLDELLNYYMQHDNSMRIIEVIKFMV